MPSFVTPSWVCWALPRWPPPASAVAFTSLTTNDLAGKDEALERAEPFAFAYSDKKYRGEGSFGFRQEDISLRDTYRVRLSLVIDPSLVAPAAFERLQRYPHLLEKYINYQVEENLAEPSKRHDMTARTFFIMNLIAKHLPTFPVDASTGMVKVNVAEIRKKETVGGKEPFRLEEFPELETQRTSFRNIFKKSFFNTFFSFSSFLESLFNCLSKRRRSLSRFCCVRRLDQRTSMGILTRSL